MKTIEERAILHLEYERDFLGNDLSEDMVRSRDCRGDGRTLDKVAEENISKLASRKERGVIDGNGDNR